MNSTQSTSNRTSWFRLGRIRFRLRTIFLSVLVVSIVLGYLGWRLGWTPAGNPLPQVSEIKNIEATLWDWKEENKIKDFDVPSKYWPQIRSSFSPARRDPRPAQWQHLGTLDITTNSGEVLSVGVYNVSSPGAFSVENESGNRTYYRGVLTSKVVSAVRAGHAESASGAEQ